MANILIVDDEPKVIEVMKPYLEDEGFTVYSASSGGEALIIAEQMKPDIVLLDWMLPGMTGLEVCLALRKVSKAGIIMVTARSDEGDRVIGLEVGADDYVTKPFGLRELTARIRALLRRMEDNAADETEEKSRLQRGDLTIDELKYRVWKRDKEIILTPAEFQILVTLAQRPGVVYSRLQLLQTTLGDAYLNYERTIDSHISHLRKKLEDDPSNPAYIQTVHGIGYRFGEQL